MFLNLDDKLTSNSLSKVSLEGLDKIYSSSFILNASTSQTVMKVGFSDPHFGSKFALLVAEVGSLQLFLILVVPSNEY